MKKNLLLIMAMTLSSSAFAQTYMCIGTGVFSPKVHRQDVELNMNGQDEKVLFESKTEKIIVLIKQSKNQAGEILGETLEVRFMTIDKKGNSLEQIAVGSSSDTVMFSQIVNDSEVSAVGCTPRHVKQAK